MNRKTIVIAWFGVLYAIYSMRGWGQETYIARSKAECYIGLETPPPSAVYCIQHNKSCNKYFIVYCVGSNYRYKSHFPPYNCYQVNSLVVKQVTTPPLIRGANYEQLSVIPEGKRNLIIFMSSRLISQTQNLVADRSVHVQKRVPLESR